jgi:uncharacterized protein DUF4149
VNKRREALPGGGAVKAAPRWESAVLVLHLLALTMAIGPAVFFAFGVAPAAFQLLTRDSAAELIGPILTRACWLAEGSFAVLFLTGWLLTKTREGSRLSRSLLTRAAILGIITSLVIEKLLIPPIEKIRQEAPGLIDNLPASDPSRILLARYHKLATSFFAADLAVALLILLVTARILSRRTSPAAPSAARPPVPKLLDLSDV